MKDCVQNLLILLLIIVLIFSITRYIKNKQMKKNINNVKNINHMVGVNLAAVTPMNNELSNNAYQNSTPLNYNTQETTITYPIDNNIINNEIGEYDLTNHHEYIPDDNVTIIEEQNQTNFNYNKEFGDEFHEYDPDEIYPSI